MPHERFRWHLTTSRDRAAAQPISASAARGSTSREEVLRSLYVWLAQTRRTVAVWQREESRFPWPLLGFIVLSLGAGFVGGALFAFLTIAASWNLVLVLVAVDYALPIGGAILLHMFFRSRNQRLDRQAEHATAPAMELPGNLIEASLVELAETDRLFPGAPYAVPRRRESAAGLAVA